MVNESNVNESNAIELNSNEASVIIIDDGNSSHSEETDTSSVTDVENPSMLQSFRNRLSGSRICNVDLRNVIGTRLRSGNSSSADFCYAFLSSSNEPKTYGEAVKSEDCEEWKKAMQDEYESLMKNNTWKLVNLPKNESVIDNRWVFKIKYNPDDSIERYKARLVVRGFTQQYGVNYSETFSPVVRYSSIRAILAISAVRKMNLVQFDVKTAFLYGDLSEDIYMKQPVGFDDKSGRVCKLTKSLYGLKQSSRCWNTKFTEFVKQFGFEVCEADPCVFVCKRNGHFTILAIYVDDGLIASTSELSISPVIDYLRRSFEIKTTEAKYYLGFEIQRNLDGSIHINQAAYTKRILHRFGLHDAHAVTTPVNNQQQLGVVEKGETVTFPYREAVGSLMFLAIGTRPDIAFAVSLVSRFLDCAAPIHVTAVKRILKYLKGTIGHGIFFDSKPNNFKFFAYSDADYAGDIVGRKSTSGNCFLLGESIISWSSELQRCTAQSTAESEYIAASEATKELMWLKRLVRCLDEELSKDLPILHLDNESAIKLTKNSEHHKRSKHIDTRYHYIREKYAKRKFVLKSVGTEFQLADIFTKALPKVRFEFLREKLNIVSK